ncbi:hypothetical protein CLF_105759 [Clonorchis sinensis]|uniref:Uncharacterized protein n=1 Tax=Clonorchis sinensis TaxID=79923 RepID=G7YE58_CLOSI|nr:hypothetical protein CLF_105759 [Clonorchis sinensis]
MKVVNSPASSCSRMKFPFELIRQSIPSHNSVLRTDKFLTAAFDSSNKQTV